MKHNLKFGTLLTILMLCTACNKYNNVDTALCIENLQEQNIGYNIDNDGDIIYIDENGSIVQNKEISGVYFRPDGKMQNRSMINMEYNKELSIKYESGETLELSEANTKDWVEYYSTQYKLDNEEVYGVYKYNGPKQSEIAYKINIEDHKYDREYIKNKIIEKYGHIDGKISKENKVRVILENIGSENDYDITYMYADLDKAIDAGKLVCWQASRIMKVLLEDTGIETEALVVKHKGGYHTLVRWKDENNIWRYSDPTYIIDKDASLDDRSKSYNIDSNTFNERYVPVDRCKLP